MENNKREIWEPSAAEKLAMEKKDGCVIQRSETEVCKEQPVIKVTISLDGEVHEYDLETLFFVGIRTGSKTKESETVSTEACLVGQYGMKNAQAIVRSIRKSIEKTPPLRLIDMLYNLTEPGGLGGGLPGLGDLFGGDDGPALF